MSMSTGGSTLTIVEAKYGGMECESYPDRLAAVLGMIDHGGLGGGGMYGCDKHKAALIRVHEQIATTRARILAIEREDNG